MQGHSALANTREMEAAMAAASPPRSNSLQVVVADDRLRAWVRGNARPGLAFTPPTEAELVAALESAKVVITDTVRGRMGELLALCALAAGKAPPPALLEGFLIAEGQAPANAEHGTLECAPGLIPADEDHAGRVDYFARRAIVTVSQGTVLGRLKPPRDGVAGVDVCGGQRIPRLAKGTPLELGHGVRLAAEGSDEVVADIDGGLIQEPHRVYICDVLVVPKDVDFSSGSIEANVDVLVRGTVRTKFHVRTTKALTVEKLIEAAEIDAGGHVTVRGGILGHAETGFVHAGGGVVASFIHEMELRAGGDVQFRKELLNTRTWTTERVLGPTGTIIGGEVYAREGVEAQIVGSDACVTTVVATGPDLNTLRRARQLERQMKDQQKSADQIRQMIQPLMANLKRLSPAQRERVTELMSKVDEVEVQMAEHEQERGRLLEAATPAGSAYVLVHEQIFPGTRIRIGAREHRVQRLLHGPVRIEMRKVNDVTEMVAVNQRTGSVTILPAADLDLDAPPTEPKARGVKPNESEQPAGERRRA